uniref:Putative capsid protein n=1 Tax=viral metagenome TaxID=1070528 RepID=A0A6H1ZEX4_9ZZZZ
MGNTIKDLSDGDLVRKYLASFHNKLKFIQTIDRQYDSRFAKSGQKNGGELLIKDPNQFTVRTGAVMDTQDVTETTQTLTVATQKGVDVNMSSIEWTMQIDDFTAMIIDPAMDRLAAQVEYDVLAGVYKNIANLTGTPATTPASFSAVLNANARLSQMLAPEGDRYLLMDSAAMAATVGAMGVYFQPASVLDKAIQSGYIGQAAGMKWLESNMVPSHTNGARDDTTPVTTTTGWANGDTTITTTGQGAAENYAAGDVFTVAGVYEVNPETKQAYSYLKQWVVTADKVADGTDVLAIAPTIYVSGAKQNCSVTGTGSKALVNVAAGGSGAASTAYTQNLAYHKNAFTFVTADLYKDSSARMSSANIEGIAMRLWRGNDIVNDKFPMRLDVLYGYKTLRPEWAVRVRG